MTRPRKPRARTVVPDPEKYQPCCRFAIAYRPVARWPDGPVCRYCYNAARNAEPGTCADCGHEGMVPGRNAVGAPTCRECSGIRLNVDCRACGKEAPMADGSRCWACKLRQIVTDLLAGEDGHVRPELKPLAEAICGMKRPNSGATWIRTNPHVQQLLRALGTGQLPLDHAAMDVLPASRTVEYVRELLVQQGVLPPRDRYVIKYQKWLQAKLDAVNDIEHRRILEQFGTWHQLRRLRDKAANGQPTENAFLRAKQSTTVALDFLRWLADQDKRLHDCSQREIDAWYAGGTTTRQLAEQFLYWAIRQRLVSSVEIPRRTYRSHPSLGEDERFGLLRRVLLHDELALTYRVVAGLVLLFGQPLHRIAAMRRDQVDIDNAADGAQVRIQFNRDWIDVSEPFATLLAAHIAANRNTNTAANPTSEWLFTGGMPGKHVSVANLAGRLQQAGIPPRASRTGTWLQLVRSAPPAVLAEALGITPQTAMKHADPAGANYLSYPQLARPAEHRHPNPKLD